MKEKLQAGGKGFFTAYALTVTFHSPLMVSAYETFLDYIIASVYELLGSYRPEFLLVWIVSAFFYSYLQDKGEERKGLFVPASFFAACLLFGNSYHEQASWEYLFGSTVNFLKSLTAFVGYTLLFNSLLNLAYSLMKKSSLTGEEPHFFSTHAFRKAFLILAAVYGAVVCISYPGTLCWDTAGQIEQVLLDTGYSTHHPLLHTFLVGGLVKLGYGLTGRYEPGLFAYMLVQVVMLAAALAATVAVLAKRKVRLKWLVGLLLLYCISPIYTNIVSVAIKDVPYCAFVVGYVILFARLLEMPELIHKKGFVTAFVLLQTGTVLFRNNGLALVFLSGLAACFYLFPQYNRREKVQYCLWGFAVSIAVSKLVGILLIQSVGAAPGSYAEMMSIPFQQTARYLQLYRNELSVGEREAIEAVFGPVEDVAAAYDPIISDPVKALFHKSASGREFMGYLLAWAKGLIRHPLVYVEAFLAHIYGWFTPTVSSAIRYEIEYPLISQQGLFPNAQKLLLFAYRFADRISVLGLLQNVGAYVWGLFFFTCYQWKERKKAFVFAAAPLWVSLLVCMASPCFLYHPRYALPILMSLPFLYVFAMSAPHTDREESNAHLAEL